MQGAKRAAAERGELRFPLPVGLVYDEEGQTIIDPDQEVHAANRRRVQDVRAGRLGLRAGRRFQGQAVKGAALPAAILSISPWFDIEMKSATLETNAATDKLLSRALTELFRESWLGGTGVAFDDPRVNMLYADLTGLPPTMIYYGEDELPAGEAVEFAARARDAGVDVSLHSVPEGQHSFIMGAGRVPEVDDAIEEMGRWLRSKLDRATSVPPHAVRR